MGIYIQYIYITKIVVLVSEPVRGRSWAPELPCLSSSEYLLYVDCWFMTGYTELDLTAISPITGKVLPIVVDNNWTTVEVLDSRLGAVYLMNIYYFYIVYMWYCLE